jgi:prepilin-type N-terminal cleavage/methylation domain-containing protein
MIGDKYMMNNFQKNKQGFTLLEIIVSLSIFSLVVVMAVGIFQAVLTSQQRAIVAQNEQESLKYVFEVVSKDIRSAVSSNHDCELVLGDLATNKIFNRETTLYSGSNALYFKDKNGDCTYYYIDNGVLMQRKEIVPPLTSATTPSDVLVKSFNFSIIDNSIGAVDSVQPMVTISLEIEDRTGRAIEKQNMTVQTTISSRNYE